jgi:hypothetical protein
VKRTAITATALFLALSACGTSAEREPKAAGKDRRVLEFVAWARAFIDAEPAETDLLAAVSELNRLIDANRPLADALEAAGAARVQATDLKRRVADEFPKPSTEPTRDLQASYLRAVRDMEASMRTLGQSIKQSPGNDAGRLFDRALALRKRAGEQFVRTGHLMLDAFEELSGGKQELPGLTLQELAARAKP